MPKINQEEYEVLKGLDDKWKWIARDTSRNRHRSKLSKYKEKPEKTPYQWLAFNYEDMDDSKFKFIQWEDGEPYNIAELIEEYENENGMRYDFGKMKSVAIDTSKLVAHGGFIYVNESEETEVKDIEWLKKEFDNLFKGKSILTVGDVNKILSQLDKPEFLSQEWIDSKKLGIRNRIPFHMDVDYAVPEEDLQSLLAPTLSEMEKVQLSQKTADELNRYKELGYSLKDLLVIAGSKQAQEKLARAWLDGFTVEKEQKYFARIKGWENVTTGSEAFNWVYFKEKDTVGISKAVENKYQATSFTKYDWDNLGINEENADFVLVKELEE